MNDKRRFWQGALCGALAMLMAAGLVSCGLGGSHRILGGETEKKLQYLKQIIDKDYLYETDDKELQTGLYEGYISGLGDVYSQYYDEEATEELMEDTEGEYDGIGAVMSQSRETGVITLSLIYEGSPAEKAGLREGDILYKVEGEEVAGRDLSEVVSDIKGDAGTEVELTVLRGETSGEITVTAVRGTVAYPTVRHELRADGIGYIRILEFDQVTYEQYVEAYHELDSAGMRGLIVDLRGNPGGNLRTVCDILDEVLGKGLIVYTEDKNGKRREFTSDEERKIDIPLAVLVNGYSASASEIFAGAVQDYGIGKIIGETTYGKGVVQQLYEFKDGTSLKLTVSEYFTPKGRNINGVGIIPDIEVKYEPDEQDPEADNQLEAAEKELKKAIR